MIKSFKVLIPAGVLLALCSVPGLAAATPLDPASSPAEGGYFLSTGASGQASSTFDVPSLNCGTVNSGVALASAVFGPSSVLSAAAAIDAKCTNGVAVYNGVVLAGTTRALAGFTPAPGDTIVASVTSTPTGTTATLSDVTQNITTAITGSAAPNVSDFVGIALSENAVSRLPAADFGKVRFSNVSMDGADLTGTSAQVTDLVSTSGVLQASTSVLNAHGSSWTETFVHA